MTDDERIKIRLHLLELEALIPKVFSEIEVIRALIEASNRKSPMRGKVHLEKKERIVERKVLLGPVPREIRQTKATLVGARLFPWLPTRRVNRYQKKLMPNRCLNDIDPTKTQSRPWRLKSQCLVREDETNQRTQNSRRLSMERILRT